MSIWIAMPGCPDYEVSEAGEVRSWKNGKWGRASSPRLLKQSIGSTGYLRVNVGGEARLVHHLVLELHVGPRPDGFEGAHFDGDKLNNHLDNLRWTSPKGNGEDNARLGVVKGELHGMHKLNDEAVRDIRKHEKTYAAYADQYGVSVGTIQRVIQGKGWTHVQ